MLTCSNHWQLDRVKFRQKSLDPILPDTGIPERLKAEVWIGGLEDGRVTGKMFTLQWAYCLTIVKFLRWTDEHSKTASKSLCDFKECVVMNKALTNFDKKGSFRNNKTLKIAYTWAHPVLAVAFERNLEVLHQPFGLSHAIQIQRLALSNPMIVIPSSLQQLWNNALWACQV